jgi:hypothetical protein
MKIKTGKGAKSCRHCGEKVPGARTLTCPHCNGDLSKDVVSLTDLIERSGVNENSVYKATYLEMLRTAGIDFLTVFPDGCNPPSDIQRIKITDWIDPKSIKKFEGSIEDNQDSFINWCFLVRDDQLRNGRYLTNAALSSLTWQQFAWKNKEEYNNIKGLIKMIKQFPDVEFRRNEVIETEVIDIKPIEVPSIEEDSDDEWIMPDDFD